jgi:hypothetical protein
MANNTGSVISKDKKTHAINYEKGIASGNHLLFVTEN